MSLSIYFTQGDIGKAVAASIILFVVSFLIRVGLDGTAPAPWLS